MIPITTRYLLALAVLFVTTTLDPAAGFEVADGPPLLNSPVFSLATTTTTMPNDSSNTATNMNIVTYASPMSIRPTRLWAIGLYKETQSYQNFLRTGRGVLQLLSSSDRHVDVVRVLGGTSGRDVDKQAACRALGLEWQSLPLVGDNDEEPWPLVLPACPSYLCVELQGDLIDGGSHDIALVRVTHMFTDATSSSRQAHLETQVLRDLGIITER